MSAEREARSAVSDEPGVVLAARPLLDFGDALTVARFHAVDDRVMGGRSRSALRAERGRGVFTGELSTERGGGFASVRSDAWPMNLGEFAGVALRVRGDGRVYRLRLCTSARPDDPSHQARFGTIAGATQTVRLAFDAFQPSWRGRAMPELGPLDPSAVRGLGWLVADGQVGRFRLELEWVRGWEREARRTVPAPPASAGPR